MNAYGPYPATVVRVIDGDSVILEMDLGFGLNLVLNCRVYGINAPEINRTLSRGAGLAAKAHAESLLPEGSSVSVLSHGWDKYGGRFNGEIKTATGDFATRQVEAQHAVWTSR